MNEKERLKEINEITIKIWNWMCELSTPIISLIPPIERIMELSEIKEKEE